MAAETRPVQPLGSLVLRVEAEQEQRYSEQQVHSSTCRSFKSGAAIDTQATEEQKETCGGRRGESFWSICGYGGLCSSGFSAKLH